MERIEQIIEILKSLKVLYVEDNQAARESTLGIFEEFFDNIMVAVDGVDGLQKFKDNEIDLVITDINMPRMNGIEMIEKIREIDEDVSILVLSAHNESNLFVESIKLGVDGYLLKPIDIEQFIQMMQKISKQIIIKKELEYKLNIYKQYQEVTDASSIVSKTDPKGIITYANKKFCQISGYSAEELLGKPHNIIRHPDMPKDAFRDMWHTIKEKKQIWQGVVKNKKKDGGFYYVIATVKPIIDEDGNIIEYIALREDITDVMDHQKQLNEFCEIYDDLIVAYIKIDNYYDIERFYGATIARKLEEKFSKILYDLLPKDFEFKKIFSLGNGEFAVAKDKRECSRTIDEIIDGFKKFQEVVNDYKIKVEELDYDISILISLSYGKNALEDAKYGLIELYKKNKTFIVAKDLAEMEQKKAEKNLKIIKMIKNAIKNSNIISYFQPIVDNRTKKVVKYESLVRFIDEGFKVLPPGTILEIAKKGHYHIEITSIILENSFKALKQLEEDISINLSILDIEKKSMREKIYTLLEENKNISKRVVFELLEDESVKDFEVVKEFIKRVKEYGVQIAIDDFGAGYSNFERVLEYEPDIVKIDGSLVKNIDTNKLSLSIVKTITAFAKEQNLKIIAEYVESENIYNILKNLGIDYSQGYFFGKPADINEIIKKKSG